MNEFTTRLDLDDIRLTVAGIVRLTDGLGNMFDWKDKRFNRKDVEAWFSENYETLAGAIMLINQSAMLLTQFLDNEIEIESGGQA